MMKPDMFQQAVDHFKHREPFKPFVVELDDGRQLIVREPKALHCYLGAATFREPGGGLMFVDSIDVKQVADLEPVASS